MNCSIHSSRVIPFSRAAIFAAMADPDRIARWWGPHGFSNVIHEFDFRPGGTWILDMIGPDGTVYPNESIFREIETGVHVLIEHLGTVHHFLLDIKLTDESGGTRIDWHMTFDDEAEREKCLAYVPRCNEENFDRLEVELRRAG